MSRAMLALVSCMAVTAAPALACGGDCLDRFPPLPGPFGPDLLAAAATLALPALLLLVVGRLRRAWCEVAACLLVAAPLALVAVAAVRLVSREWGRGAVALSWDPGLVAPNVSAGLTTLLIGALAAWAWRRGASVGGEPRRAAQARP